MNIIAVDPGSTHSAFVEMSKGDTLLQSGYMENEKFIKLMSLYQASFLAIETLHVRGMPTSQDELETQFWAGRFVEAFGRPFTQVRREVVKGHFGASGVSNPDKVIRESLIGRFGGTAAVGGVKCKACHGKKWSGRGHLPCVPCNATGWECPPGPFYEWTGSDRWSALAIGCWWWDVKSVTAAARCG